MLHQRQDIPAGGLPQIDNEIGMAQRHSSITDPGSFEASLVDEPTGRDTVRVFERASR